MTNEPNLKMDKNSLTPLTLRTTNHELQTGEAQNEPKRSQKLSPCQGGVPAGGGGLSMFVNPVNPVQTKKTQNKPIFKTSQIAISNLSKTGYCSLVTVDCEKNKPIFVARRSWQSKTRPVRSV
jgi:hypothetical protein